MMERALQVKEIEKNSVLESPLAKQAALVEIERPILEYDKSLVYGSSFKLDDSNRSSENPKRYFDVNGVLYREGKDLMPNVEYQLNGYKYKTDERNRIISAEGALRVKEHVGRLPIKASIEEIGKGDERCTDDKGHLIGDQFGGSNEIGNLISQDAEINRKDFRNFENELARQVKEGKEVIVQIEPLYNKDSNRPENIIVSYSIDGERNMRIFPNGGN